MRVYARRLPSGDHSGLSLLKPSTNKGNSRPSGRDLTHNRISPARTPENASLLPSRVTLVIQALTPGEVTALPGPVIRPRLASNGYSHALTLPLDAVKASFLPSGESAGPVSRPPPEVNWSTLVARDVSGSMFNRQRLLAPRRVRSRYSALPEGAQVNFESTTHSFSARRCTPRSLNFCRI